MVNNTLSNNAHSFQTKYTPEMTKRSAKREPSVGIAQVVDTIETVNSVNQFSAINLVSSILLKRSKPKMSLLDIILSPKHYVTSEIHVCDGHHGFAEYTKISQ